MSNNYALIMRSDMVDLFTCTETCVVYNKTYLHNMSDRGTCCLARENEVCATYRSVSVQLYWLSVYAIFA